MKCGKNFKLSWVFRTQGSLFSFKSDTPLKWFCLVSSRPEYILQKTGAEPKISAICPSNQVQSTKAYSLSRRARGSNMVQQGTAVPTDMLFKCQLDSQLASTTFHRGEHLKSEQTGPNLFSLTSAWWAQARRKKEMGRGQEKKQVAHMNTSWPCYVPKALTASCVGEVTMKTAHSRTTLLSQACRSHFKWCSDRLCNEEIPVPFFFLATSGPCSSTLRLKKM